MALSQVSQCDLLKYLDESKGVDLDTNQELCQATDLSLLSHRFGHSQGHLSFCASPGGHREASVVELA